MTEQANIFILDKNICTHHHFEQMGLHDKNIYGLTIQNREDNCAVEFLLDIGYILKWILSVRPALKLITILTIVVLFSACNNNKVKKEYYDNKKLKSIFIIKNGKIDGKKVTFYENGSIKEESIYENGLLNGECKYFSDSNYLKELKIYSQDILDYYAIFNGNGELTSEKRKVKVTLNSDTINYGEKYFAKIFLTGPPLKLKAEGYMGYSNTDYTGRLNSIPFDGEYFIINIKPEKVGVHKITGLIRLSVSEDSVIDVIPFSLFFYVNPII